MSLKYCPVNDAQCLMDCGDICQQRGGTQDAGEYSDGFKAGREAGMREAGKDTARLDWMIEHGTDYGGGRGFEFSVYIPYDSECLRDAIDRAILSAIGGGK